MMRWSLFSLVVPALVVAAPPVDPEAAARGRQALEQRSFAPPSWSLQAYENVWKQWGPDLKEKPADYAEAFRQRYGLHPAPFPNDGYPMGLRKNMAGFFKGLSVDCLICH